MREIVKSHGFDWAKNIYLGNMQFPFHSHNLEWTIEPALEFIEESANKDKPFFLQMCPTLLHGPDKEWDKSTTTTKMPYSKFQQILWSRKTWRPLQNTRIN